MDASQHRDRLPGVNRRSKQHGKSRAKSTLRCAIAADRSSADVST
jgi:hypothetical protein